MDHDGSNRPHALAAATEIARITAWRRDVFDARWTESVDTTGLFEAATATGSAELMAQVRMTLCAVDLIRGRWADVNAHVDAALEAVTVLDIDSWAPAEAALVTPLYTAAGILAQLDGDFDEARRWIARAFLDSVGRGELRYTSRLWSNLAVVEVLRGDLARSADFRTRLLRWRGASHEARVEALVGQAQIAIVDHDDAVAQQILDGISDADLDFGWKRQRLLLARLTLAIRAQDLELAARLAEHPWLDLRGGAANRVLGARSRLLLAQGDPSAAAALLDAGISEAGESGVAQQHVMALLRAEVAVAEGSTAKASALLDSLDPDAMTFDDTQQALALREVIACTAGDYEAAFEHLSVRTANAEGARTLRKERVAFVRLVGSNDARFDESEHTDDAMIDDLIERSAVGLLEQVVRKKHDLLGMVAHDLRGALTTTEFARTILDEDALSVTQRTGAVDAIRQATKAMRSILVALTALARTDEMGEVDDYPVRSIGEVVSAVVDTVSQDAQRKGQRIDVIDTTEPDTVADGAPDVCAIIISNLLTNAVKYSGEGQSIEVRIREAVDGGGAAWLLVEVEDHGVGMSETDRLRAWDRYTRVGNVEMGIEPGLGLGLYIVREFTELLGGRVTAESKLGEGTTFQLSLRPRSR